ncbi:carnitine 3-dehydrogenase [Paracoccus sp. Ld10]|uniref:carnitine 3-dehydrogenase n=1 Tax=Paracoccus sp. Ld10 TaxID=649158 RepID=UPI00386FE4E0
MTQIAAIIGGGVIGGGWAARFALSGWNVTIFDPDPEAARKIDAVMANARRSLPALSDVALPPEGQVKIVPTLAEAVANADWIQESAPERLEMKHRILNEIQTHCRKDALIGSSTSGFKPSELQQGALRPEQIFVAHPFNPVYLLPLIELVGDDQTTARAHAILTEIGMKPLKVRKEIDAHIADRFLEAVWREALWLVKDGIATTQEIDDAIRYGFGLRWGQMGLFETYRVAGGEAGMAHFIAQFGPCLQWPWTKLMDVPELTDELVHTIASQSDAQSGSHSIRELERIRDDNLVSMMRSLKGRNWGAGALLNEHDARLCAGHEPDFTKPFISVDRSIPVDWSDYNGHMNESRYGQVWSDAADAVMRMIGADADYIAAGLSYFTVDTHTKFMNECHVGEHITVETQILEGAGKKLQLFHEMKNASGALVASCTQLLIHVSLETRKSCDPGPQIVTKLAAIMAAQAALSQNEAI